MPISPTPPSGTKTSSSCGDAICVTEPSCHLWAGWAAGTRGRRARRQTPRSTSRNVRAAGTAGFLCRSPHPTRPIERKYLPGRNHLKAARSAAQHQPPDVVDSLETSSRLALGKPHTDRLSKSRGAGKPRIPDAGKAGSVVPLREARLHRGYEIVEQ